MTKKSRQKFKYLDNKKSFSDEMRSILHHFESTFIEAKKKKKSFLERQIPTLKLIVLMSYLMQSLYASFRMSLYYYKVFHCLESAH